MSQSLQQIHNYIVTTAVSWLSLLLLIEAAVDAQITYRDQANVEVAWTASTGHVGIGNGMFVSPKYNAVVSLSSDCTLKAFEPTTGVEHWEYSTNGTCTGGVFFTDKYIAYIVSNIFTDSSAIHAVDYTGRNLFTTASLTGVGVGTPVATANGQYLMATSNAVDNIGSFTAFNIEMPGSPAYTYTGQDPFGEIGYYHNPVQGYFDGGFENPNDVFIWSTGIPSTCTGVGEINGTTYAFQLPFVATNPLVVTIMAKNRAFVSNEPPVLANGGLNMYWSTYENEFWAWTGQLNVRFNAFGQRGNTTRPTTGRGDPLYISARAPPTLSSNGTQPTVFGPQADGYIFKANFDYSVFQSFATEDGQPVSSRVVISPDETVLFYASSSGSLVQLDADSMNKNYAIHSEVQYLGEIAQSADGAYIYVADTGGNIRAYLVADVVGGPTLEPLPGLSTLRTNTSWPVPEEPSASLVTPHGYFRLSSERRTQTSDGQASDLPLKILVKGGFVVLIFLIALVLYCIQGCRQPAPALHRPPAATGPSGVAASVAPLSTAPVAPKVNDHLPAKTQKNPFVDQNLSRSKNQFQPDVDKCDGNCVPVVPPPVVPLGNSMNNEKKTEKKTRPRGIDP